MRPVLHAYRVVLPALVLMSLLAGCASGSNRSEGTIVHTVNVAQDIKPLQIDAGKGDEIRWVNKRSHPVAIIFPGTEAPRISCLQGFQAVDRSVLSAVVQPNASASLCFTRQGKYDYQVRLDENMASAETDRNATVWIVGGGERNPKPGEQFENITP
jgi:plastocyanin